MKKCIAGVALLLFCFVVFAHEYILLAESYTIEKGDTGVVRLFVSDGFNIEMERPFQRDMTRSLNLYHTNGVQFPIQSISTGSLPFLTLPIDFDGDALISLERNYARISLPTEKFRAYLKEDHIENITIPKSAENKLQKERYSRYIKCLLHGKTEGAVDTTYKTRTGSAFEIVLLDNPYLMEQTTDWLRILVLFDGKPLAGKVITARNRKGNEASTVNTARTNSAGVCRLKIKDSGEWFIHATHLIPCPDQSDADWESFWASYSFGFVNRD